MALFLEYPHVVRLDTDYCGGCIVFCEEMVRGYRGARKARVTTQNEYCWDQYCTTVGAAYCVT